MLGSAPKFPAFETWKSMSEGEQDALLATIERSRRQRSIAFRSFLGLGLVVTIVAIGIGIAVHAGLVGGR